MLSRAVTATNTTLHQAGVIAYRILDGKVQVLLMTSRDTGRWIIPKGNIDAGATPAKAAEKEAAISFSVDSHTPYPYQRCASARFFCTSRS